jgi:hypothetical protein
MDRLIYKLLPKDRGAHVLGLRDWKERSLGVDFCRTCKRVDRRRYPEPVDAHILEIPKGTSASNVSFRSIGIIRADLRNQLSRYMQRFVFGRCFDANGARLGDYSTHYTDSFILIRGSRDSKYYPCAECGSVGSLWEEPAYVVRSELGAGPVYNDDGCTLYVSEELVTCVDWSRFADIELFPFEIRNEAIDGREFPQLLGSKRGTL